MKPHGLKCYVGALDEARQGLILAESQEEARGIVGWKAWRFKKYWYVVVRREWWPIPDPRPRTLYSREWGGDRWGEEGADEYLADMDRLFEVARAAGARARRG